MGRGCYDVEVDVMSENKGTFEADGLEYDYEFKSFDVAYQPDEIDLLKTAVMCLGLAIRAIDMSSKTNNYFTENNELYINMIKVIRDDIKERT